MSPSYSIHPEIRKIINNLPLHIQRYIESLLTDILIHRVKAKQKYYGVKTNSARNEYTFPLPDGYQVVITFDLHYCCIVSISQVDLP